jgi:hypothetical protein
VSARDSNPAQSERCVRRVLYKGDPSADDLFAARAEIESIRDEMSRLRGRLKAVGRVETGFWFDSVANAAAGSLTMAVMALYSLCDGGQHDLKHRANRLRDLWADAEAHPDAYAIKEGKSRV